MKRVKNIGKTAVWVLLGVSAWTNAQAGSFTISVFEQDGTTPKTGGSAVAGRYYPMTVINSDSSYTGTHGLTISTTAPNGGDVPQVCSTPTPGNCATVSACQNADTSTRPTDFIGGVANLCLVMPDIGTFTVNMDDGSGTTGSGPTLNTPTPSYFELTQPSILNRSELSCSTSPDYTYIGEALTVKFSLIARNEAGATTANYSGATKFAMSNVADWTTYDANGSMGLGFGGAGYTTGYVAGSSADSRISIISSPAALAPSAQWSNGQGNFQVTLKLSRNATSEAPYDGIAIGIRPKDGDGVALRGTDFNLDADGNGSNERMSVGTTKLKYGRLKIFNAYGSDLLPLPVDVQAQVWNGTAFVDFKDSCTPLDGGYFTLAQVGTGQTALPQPDIDPDTGVVGAGTLDTKGHGRIALKKPSTTVTGKAITAIRTRPDNATPAPPGLPGLDSYLPGLGTGTFGLYKAGPVLYRRELHYR